MCARCRLVVEFCRNMPARYIELFASCHHGQCSLLYSPCFVFRIASPRLIQSSYCANYSTFTRPHLACGNAGYRFTNSSTEILSSLHRLVELLAVKLPPLPPYETSLETCMTEPCIAPFACLDRDASLTPLSCAAGCSISFPSLSGRARHRRLMVAALASSLADAPSAVE